MFHFPPSFLKGPDFYILCMLKFSHRTGPFGDRMGRRSDDSASGKGRRTYPDMCECRACSESGKARTYEDLWSSGR